MGSTTTAARDCYPPLTYLWQATDGHLMGYELSVTRALGHRGLEKHGVIADPYVMTRDLDER